MEVSVLKTRGPSVFEFSSWLTAFLNRRSLKQPDQRPLYEYHVSNEEYGDLKRLLSGFGNKANFTHDKSANACFTLFCAEWYRREYEHGWSWDPIWSTLDFSLSAGDLRRVIPKGLEGFWGRPIRFFYESERRNFLGSVYSEGGLPFRLLKQSHSRFQSVFARILKQYESAQLLGYSTRQLVTSLIEQSGLPQVFSEDMSVELVAQMADELVSIVQLYGLYKHDDPVNELDAVSPKWRERFPIPLDEETGNEFLNGLLHSAIPPEPRPKPVFERSWNCIHFFTNQNSDVLQTEISFPKEVTFNLGSEPPSCRFELAICEAEKQLVSLGAGYAVLDNRRARVRLKHKLVRCKRQSPSDNLTLVALYGGSILAEIPIQNSAVTVGEIPLGFESVDERWQLCGQASFRTKCIDILLLLPSDSELDVEGGVYTDHNECLGCYAVKVQGQCVVSVVAEETFRIRTGLASANFALDLKGDVLKWPCAPSPAFLGVPTVEWLNSDPALGAKGAYIYLSGNLVDACSLQQRLGRHYLSVRNNENETLLRKRIGILPADFKIKLKNGEQPNQGSILFYSSTPCLYRLETSHVEARRVRHDDHIELFLEVNGIPPAHVSVLVTPNLESDPIRIELPFPASGYLAFDKDEQPLLKSLPVSDLLGARVYLFGRAEQSATNYRMELSLKGGTASNACYTWHTQVRDKPVEVSLFNLKDQIESLLSLQTGIDQIVELTIDNKIVCRIGRYAVEMHLDFNRRLLVSSANISKRGKLPKPMLMLLCEPERHPIELRSRVTQGVATGEFELPDVIDKAGPWLIVPQKSSSVAFRPLFLAGNLEQYDHINEIRNLQKAALMFSPTSSSNSFEPVLNAMALDPTHSSWQFLRALYDNYGYLPLSTFEVWRALVRIPSALAMAMFKFEMSVDFISRIEAEFPFIWELFPISEIKKAADRLKHYLLQKGIREDFLPEFIKKMYQRFSETIPSFNGNIQQWLNDGYIPKEAQMPKAIMQDVIFDWYQNLIRARSGDDDWPKFGVNRLKGWCLSQQESPISFQPEDKYIPVVYFPVFAAAVAVGKSKFDDVFVDSADAIFFLRLVRDFDTQWFDGVYQYSLLRYISNNN